MKTPLALCLVLATLVGCSKETKPSTEPAGPAAAEPSGGVGTQKADITWTDAKGFERLPSASAMRVASYKYAAVKGDKEPAELAVFYFGPSMGGSVESNVDRWLGQFPDVDKSTVKRSDRSIHGMTQHIVEIDDATYQSGMPGGAKTAKEHFGFVGVIVEAPTGNHFFKLTGPKATVAAARAGFFQMMDSVRTKS